MQDEIDFYKKTVELMIELYCRNKHKHLRVDKMLCTECLELKKYSSLKLNNCVYGKNKPACTKCSTHCFKPIIRTKIKTVMKYSGKRMIFSYPMVTIKYLLQKFR
jgi:hypothetical protein